ncbi:MAG TPA: SIS domain-containing protein [Anaerolineae bacterium]|nr:SIS domain-containing protein [Anaerolineae bacterium]
MSTSDEKLSQAIALARNILRQEAETLLALAEGLDAAFWTCAQLISRCEGLVWVTGVGTSAAVAQRFAHILSSGGTRSMFLHPSDGLHGHSGVLAGDDLLIAMSRGGESSEVNRLVAIANQRGVTTVAFVHDTASSLAKACQHVLPIPSKQEYELMGVLATTSTVAFSAMCDALAGVILEARGYTLKEFIKTHPGGAVGKRFHERTDT